MSRLFLASFDIEDWFHTENLGPTVGTADWTSIPARVERNTHALLDLLADCRVQGTFFVLGWVARRHPSLVRRIADEGHEVAITRPGLVWTTRFRSYVGRRRVSETLAEIELLVLALSFEFMPVDALIGDEKGHESGRYGVR